MANTAFNPSDKTANITLTGSNLIATCNSSVFGGVRAVDRQITGKFYWECTHNTVSTTSEGAGVLSAGAPLNASSAWQASPGFIGACGLVRGGVVYVDGSSSITVGGASGSIAFGTITNGTVVCLAVDITAKLMWFRLGAAGNWNNVSGRDPATGAGGIAINTLGGAIPVYPAVLLSNNLDQITANFGDSAFTGTVPSGFTSGFTAGATINTNALATQIAIEHWLTTNPNMQTTQVALEHWATVSSAGVQAAVTQVALEHWASVSSVSAITPQARAMVLA